MSEADSVQSKEVSNSEENEFVKADAYKQVSQDMHKYKQSLREAKALIAELEAQKKASDEEKMMEQQRWKELYENKSKEAETLKKEKREERNMYLDSIRKSRLREELGGVKEAYLVHAKVSDIEFNEDGTLNRSSLEAVANRFREEYPELLPKRETSAVTDIPPGGPSGPAQEKPISEMSFEERVELLEKIRYKE